MNILTKNNAILKSEQTIDKQTGDRPCIIYGRDMLVQSHFQIEMQKPWLRREPKNVSLVLIAKLADIAQTKLLMLFHFTKTLMRLGHFFNVKRTMLFID